MTTGAIPAVGSRAQVWHGNAKHTAGGLEKKDLAKNRKSGRIVSKRRRSSFAKLMKNNPMARAKFSENRRRIERGEKPLPKSKLIGMTAL